MSRGDKMDKVEEFLQHHGVKGMKWGVRRFQPYPKGEGRKGRFIGKIKSNRNVRSKVREIKTLNKARLKNLDKMSTAEIRKETRRLALENKLKKYSKLDSNVSRVSGKDHADYLRRENMSDEELKRKVDRLISKAEFKKQANLANKGNLEVGKAIATTAATMTAGYLIAKTPDIAAKLQKLNTPTNRAAAINLFKMAAKGV